MNIDGFLGDGNCFGNWGWFCRRTLEILGQDPTHIQVGSEDNASANADITQHIVGVLDVLKVPKKSSRVE